MAVSTLKALSIASVGAAVLAFGGVESAQALTLTFDDLTPTIPFVNESEPLSSYGGLEWQRTNYVTTASAVIQYGQSGYEVAAVSTPNVIFNAFRNGANSPLVVTKTGGGAFNFISTYITNIWRDGQTVTVAGLLGGVTQYSSTVNPLTTSANLFTFNYLNIDTLTFTPTGGTQNPNFGLDGNQFALDNFTYTAIPTPALLPGLVALGVATWRKRHSEVAEEISQS